MIFVVVPKTEYNKSMSENSLSVGFVEQYYVLKFHSIDLVGSALDNYKRFKKPEFNLINQQIRQGIVPEIKKASSIVSIDELSKSDTVSGYPKFIAQADEGNFDTIIAQNVCTDGSEWTMKPAVGNILFVQKSEIQFTHDIALDGDAVLLEYYAWHPANPTEPILAQQIRFDTLYSMYEYGNTHSHSPAVGTEIPFPLTTIHFNYVKKLVFFGSRVDGSLAELKIRTESGNPISGTYCKATFVTETQAQ